jgi:hypothetical protein
MLEIDDMIGLLDAVRWDLVGAGFQLALCALILGRWARCRLSKHVQPTGEVGAPPPPFAQEVWRQAICQQTEHSLQRILSTIERERLKLQEVLAGVGPLRPTAEAGTAGPGDSQAGFRWAGTEPDEMDFNRYAGVNELAQQGLGSRQIADQLNLPAGEIELALKLHGSTPDRVGREEMRQ